MKKYIIVILIVMFISSVATAETSIALKKGYTVYDQERVSVYEGNNIYDREFTDYGGFIRYVRRPYIYRLDIDTMKTGGEFANPMPIAYEGVDIRMTPVVFSFGRYIYKGIYGLFGAGYSFNKIEIEKYAPYPFNESMDNSMVLSATLGYEQKIGNKWFGFVEGRYSALKAKVNINGSHAFTEDLSNKTVFVGFGRKL